MDQRMLLGFAFLEDRHVDATWQAKRLIERYMPGSYAPHFGFTDPFAELLRADIRSI
jgi:hypothetical protein